MKLTKREIVLLGVIIYFTFIGGTFYSQLNFFLRVANQVIVSLILGGWLFKKIVRKQGLSRTTLDFALIFYLAVNFLSAFLGQSPRFSLETLWFSVVHIVAFYLLVDLIRRDWIAGLTWAVYMAATVVCMVSLVEFAAWYVGTPILPGFAQGWFGIGGWQNPMPPIFHRVAVAMSGPTPLSAYLALLIPPAIGLIITLPRRDQNRQALMIWLVLAFAVQILTFSRAGILALGVSLPLTALGWYKAIEDKPQVSKFWSRLSLWHRAAIVLVGLVIVGSVVFWFQSSFSNRTSSTSFRFTLWYAAVDIFQNDPLTGAGPANFSRALLQMNEASLPRAQIATAHSIYLNTAAELGMLGLLVGGYLIFMVGISWGQHWRQSSHSKERIRVAACGAALAGLAAQTVVDTYLATPNMLIMLGLAAYIVAGLRSEKPANHHRATAYVAISVLLMYLLALMWLILADLHFQRSFRLERAGNGQAAIDEAAQAQSLDPALPLRTFRLALLEARLAAQNNDQAILQSAVNHYRLGLQEEPVRGLNSANLAGLLWQQGNHSEAIEVLQQTILAEENPLYWVNLGYFFEQTKNWPEAVAAYGRALFLSPDLAGSGFWQASPARAEKWSDVVAAAIDNVDAEEDALSRESFKIELALAREDFDTIITITQMQPALVTAEPHVREALIETYLSRGQVAEAIALLDPEPQTALDYSFWGRVNLVQGNEEKAEVLLKTAIFMGHHQSNFYLGQLYEQRKNLQAAEQAYIQGFQPHAMPENIEITIYDRFGGNDLAPQLIRIGIGPGQARSWLALANLYQQQQRFQDAKRIYAILLAADPYLEIARQQLELLDTSP